MADLVYHARLVDPDEFADFLAQAPPRPFDCMLEARDKEKALLLLCEHLSERWILRPEAWWRGPSEGLECPRPSGRSTG